MVRRRGRLWKPEHPPVKDGIIPIHKPLSSLESQLGGNQAEIGCSFNRGEWRGEGCMTPTPANVLEEGQVFMTARNMIERSEGHELIHRN